MAGPKLPDLNSLIQAGINPKTGLPIKMGPTACMLKENLKKNFRIMDEQNAINRYTWYNLPDTLDGQLLERILYYRGQGMLFYMKTDNSFYFLPYALNGTIDCYGRYTGVTPLPFNGTSQDGKEKPWIDGLVRKPLYGIKYDEVKETDFEKYCVLLNDYSKQIAQNVIPRVTLQDPLLDTMSEMVPYMRTALMNSTGIKGMRVSDADSEANVQAAAIQVQDAALTGKPWIPVIGGIEFQELTDGTTVKAEDYMIALQGLDNLRLSMLGLDNGGIYEKKTVVTDSQMMMNYSPTSLVYQDGLTLRQNFCDTVNSLWGLNIWCDASESVLGIDKNLDGEQDRPEPGVDASENKEDTVNDTNV